MLFIHKMTNFGFLKATFSLTGSTKRYLLILPPLLATQFWMIVICATFNAYFLLNSAISFLLMVSFAVAVYLNKTQILLMVMARLLNGILK